MRAIKKYNKTTRTIDALVLHLYVNPQFLISIVHMSMWCKVRRFSCSVISFVLQLLNREIKLNNWIDRSLKGLYPNYSRLDHSLSFLSSVNTWQFSLHYIIEYYRHNSTHTSYVSCFFLWSILIPIGSR